MALSFFILVYHYRKKMGEGALLFFIDEMRFLLHVKVSQIHVESRHDLGT